MRNWKPQNSTLRWIAPLLLLLVFAGFVTLMTQIGLALARPPEGWLLNARFYLLSLGALGILGTAVFLAQRTAGAWSLRYGLDRNGLYILWLGNTATIPLGQIERIEQGAGRNLSWFGWLRHGIGYYHGRLQLADGRPLYLFASLSPAARSSLLIHTATTTYSISPVDPEAFVQELEQRQRLGVIQQLPPTIEYGNLFAYAFWSDRTIRRAVIGAIAGYLLLLGAVMLAYPGLPELIQLRFDAAGNLAELRPRYQILLFPLAAATITLLNAGLGLMVYSREPVGARLLQFASLLVQFLFAVATAAVIV